MCIKVKPAKIRYTEKPSDGNEYTQKMDRIYSRWTGAYDIFIALFPPWRRWLRSVIPHITGNDLLEVSFGTGFLLTQYPEGLNVSGLDFNGDMVESAGLKMKKLGRPVSLVQGNVENMPYDNCVFDTVVNTMAFSGYPDGEKALSEMLRVLKPGGRLLLVDYDYPGDRNILGYWMVRFIEKCGDIMKDIQQLLEKTGCSYECREIGASGSVQLFIISKEN